MDFAWEPWMTQGGVAIVAIVGILTGRIVPGRVVDRIEREHKAHLQEIRLERDDWRAAARIDRDTVRQLTAQLDELLELARTTDAVLRSLPRVPVKGERR